MTTFICLFAPAVISVWIYEALIKNDMGLKKWIYRFSLNTLLINLSVFFVKKFIFSTSTAAISNMSPEAAIRYLVVAVPAAVLLAFVQMFFTKNIKINVCEEEDEQKK